MGDTRTLMHVEAFGGRLHCFVLRTGRWVLLGLCGKWIHQGASQMISHSKSAQMFPACSKIGHIPADRVKRI